MLRGVTWMPPPQRTTYLDYCTGLHRKFIRARGVLFLVLFTRYLNYIFEKNRNQNKRIKNLSKRNLN